MKTGIMTVVAVIAMIATSFAFVGADLDADSGFDITDGEGRTFHYDAPAEHMVTTSFATTLTVAEAGAIDKIVAADKYSMYDTYKNENLKDLNAVDLGSFFSTNNHDYIVTTLVGMVESGEMNLDDTIILVSYSANRQLCEKLEDIGFTKVLMWLSIDEYDGLIDFIKDVSMIATGTVPESVQMMNEKLEAVKDGTSGVPENEHAKALFVWYTNGTLDVGNATITNSMIEAINAVNIGFKEPAGGHYGDTNLIVTLLSENPGTVVFINNSYGTAGKTVEDFRNDVLGGDKSIPVVIMDSLWNNWCPESADGLFIMSQYLYPEIMGEPYEGYMNEYGIEHGSDDDGVNMTMVAGIIVGFIVVIVAAYILIKRKSP